MSTTTYTGKTFRRHFACTFCGASHPGGFSRIRHALGCIVPATLAACAPSSRYTLAAAYTTETLHRVMQAGERP